jgi:carboxyl-terminal processing protease
VCTKKDTFPDGAESVGKGIDPDVVMHPAIADVQAGRDTALDRALAFLRNAAGN